MTRKVFGPLFPSDPESMLLTESSTLTSTSNHADSATIDNGIGDVPVNGSITVSPAETTTYTITVAGPGGTAMAGVTVTIISLSITITSPVDGDTIYRPDIMVQGTIPNIEGNEMGVTVNGIVAMVEGTQFVANHVPLEEGENTITASSTNPNGGVESASITVFAEITGNYITITADTESGISPLATNLKVEGSFTFTEDPVITNNGPGNVIFTDNPEDNKYDVSIMTPGIYFFTAEAQDDQSNTYIDTVAVLVMDQAELDALLRTKWEGMRQALAQNDVNGAVSYFSESTKESYREMFTILSDSLTEIEQELSDIQFIDIMKNAAECDIRITRDGNEYSFYLLFIKDVDGLWKIKSF